MVMSDLELELDVLGVYGIVNALPRCELKDEELDILRAIYGQAYEERRFGNLIRVLRHLMSLSITTTGAVVLDDVLSGSKTKGKGKEKVVIDLTSSGREYDASSRERRSRRMFEELVGEVGPRLSN
ncbi:hypothetical protein Adt_39412 [Abeliophyllum distichum]|uniref:Uncharacterized protein n=1 Tax=Abeliophyllum distichum TaxID=126358 RepID=A0ABD1Q4Z7_9LAMI